MRERSRMTTLQAVMAWIAGSLCAGMARISVAAAFVQAKMPLDNGGTLTDQEAYDVAAYFTARPRPDFTGRQGDWPHGGRPADAR
jgi:thiosulfate dehydrogenase